MQLGYVINARKMTMSLPVSKRHPMLHALQHIWQSRRKSFAMREAANLVGSLTHFCQVCPWGKFIFQELHHSIYLALKINKNTLLQSLSF